jgi:hypothetical protein
MIVASAYPIRVDARLDPHLSRFLWLSTWHLAISRFIVLAPIDQKTAPVSRATRTLGRARRLNCVVL